MHANAVPCTCEMYHKQQHAISIRPVYVEHEIKALHARVTHMQSSTRWLHTAKCMHTAHYKNHTKLHTSQCTLSCTLHLTECTPYTAHCTILTAECTKHTAGRAVLDITEQFWPKIWSHFRCYYSSSCFTASPASLLAVLNRRCFSFFWTSLNLLC